MSKYMFETREITGVTGYQLWEAQSHGALICDKVDGYERIYKYTDPCTLEYCFVFSDEADQFSNPYPTAEDAEAACKHYMELL